MSDPNYMNSFDYDNVSNKPPIETKPEYVFTAKNPDMLNAMAAFARDKHPGVNFRLEGLNMIVGTSEEYNALLEPFYPVLMS